jgi:hypothetical protein
MMFDVVQNPEMKVGDLLPKLALSPDCGAGPGEAGDSKVSAGQIRVLLGKGCHEFHNRVLRTAMLKKELSVLVQLGLH